MKKREVQTKYLLGLAARLLLAILLAVNSLAIFYFVFTPLTVFPSFWLIKLFYPITIDGRMFFYSNFIIEIVNACVAGSAYYLFVLMNLTTKGIDIKTRIKAFVFGALSLLTLNVLRIVILVLILFGIGSHAFNQIHLSFWVVGSTIFVFGIWILTIKIFKIKEIPIYSDFKEVLKLFGSVTAKKRRKVSRHRQRLR